MSPKLLNILLIVASFAVYYLLIGPLWTGAGSIWSPSRGGVSTLKTEAASYQETVSQAETLFAKGKDLRNQYMAIDDETKQKMIQMVPQKVDPIRLLSEFDGIAASSGVSPPIIIRNSPTR